MQLFYFDTDKYTTKIQTAGLRELADYRKIVQSAINGQDQSRPEYALAHVAQPSLHEKILSVKKNFRKIKHLVLVGIGGSDLGTRAVHSVLGNQQVELHTLDTVSSQAYEQLLAKLDSIKKKEQLAVCVVSKSGSTTETLVNAGVLLNHLQTRFGSSIYQQTIFIGDVGTDFMKTGKRLGVTCVSMPTTIVSRYSVATEVSLIPLALLGHDTDSFIEGILDTATPELESISAENAVRLAQYWKQKYHHYNFFAFDPRLEKMGAWYRQLWSESLGKAQHRDGQKVTGGLVPTISTPVDLHSTGQLYFSGLAGVYTDFVVFEDLTEDVAIPKKGLAGKYSRYTMSDIATAIYGGVVNTYQEKQLPYRSTILDGDNLAYSVGLFMGSRMLEVMYLAELLDINAFDQPNVESYKEKTRAILKIS